MEFNNIYEVTRDDYVGFIETIKPEARRKEVIEADTIHTIIKTFSKKTGKCLCSRIVNRSQTNPDPEKYYIFELPEAEESLPPRPKRKITLETKEEVQLFLNYISKMQKERDKDAGNIQANT